MEDLQKQGMQKLILDLRDNGGGFINQAMNIADEFLDDNKLIVYTQGANVKGKNIMPKKKVFLKKENWWCW